MVGACLGDGQSCKDLQWTVLDATVSGRLQAKKREEILRKRRFFDVQSVCLSIRSQSVSKPFANRSLPPNSVSKISREPLADPLAQIELDFLAQALGEATSLKSLLIEREKTLGIGPEGSLAGQIESAMAHARTMIESPVCPIVAVLGMLNAGKSSLVATFLSTS
jgi:hypothetical protein